MADVVSAPADDGDGEADAAAIAAYCKRREPCSAMPATCHTRASMMQPIAEPRLPRITKITRSVGGELGIEVGQVDDLAEQQVLGERAGSSRCR